MLGASFAGLNMVETRKIHIAYATDEGYLMPTLVAAASAVAWASERAKIVIHILDVGVSDERWVWFYKRLRLLGDEFGLKRHVIDESRFLGMRRWHGSLAAYARIFLADLLPNIEWCVYCDGDTLFTDNPLNLIKIFDSNCAIQGHSDWLGANGLKNRIKWYETKGLIFDYRQYFCSGFILLNLKWFRENDGVRKCLNFLSEYPDAICPDQDALAVVCRGHIGWVPDEWGLFSCYVGTGNKLRPSCIHYANELPWDFRFNWHVGYYDVRLLWVKYAWSLLRLRPADFGGPGNTGWYWRMVYRYLIMFVSYALYPLPLFRKRYAWVYNRFKQRKIVRLCELKLPK